METLPIELAHKIYRESTKDFFQDFQVAHWNFHVSRHKGPTLEVIKFESFGALVCAIRDYLHAPNHYIFQHICKLLLANKQFANNAYYQKMIEFTLDRIPRGLQISQDVNKLYTRYKTSDEPHVYMPLHGTIGTRVEKIINRFGPASDDGQWHLVFNDIHKVSIKRCEFNEYTFYIMSESKHGTDFVFSLV